MSWTWVPRLNEQQIEQVQKQSHTIWGEGLDLQERLSRLNQLLHYKEGKYLHMAGLLNESKELVCSCKMYTLYIRHHQQVIKTHGFGAVFTPPEHRKKGYAETMIHHALLDACEAGYEAAFLFSDIGPMYYEKFGYQTLPSEACEIAVKDIIDSEIELTGEQDYQTGVKILKQVKTGIAITYAYTPETYEFYKMRNSAQGFDLVLWNRGKRVAFVSALLTDKGLNLNEFALLDTHYFLAVWSYLKKLALYHKKNTIYGWWPLGVDHPGTRRNYRPTELPMLASLTENKTRFTSDLAKAHFGGLGYF